MAQALQWGLQKQTPNSESIREQALNAQRSTPQFGDKAG